MKRPRVRLCRLIPIAFLVGPPLFWGLVLTITPTECARGKIVAKLEAATGRSIRLGALRIGALGGVHLTGLEIGAPGSAHDPWLKAESARIDISVLQLLTGQLEPSEVRVEGLSLRVLRRKDGTVELGDLLRSKPMEASSKGDHHEAVPLEVQVSRAHITVIDEPSQTRLELEGVEGHATWQERLATIQELRGMLNEGPFELRGSFDRTPARPVFEVHFHADGVALDDGTSALTYLIPILSKVPEARAFEGKLSAKLDVRGEGISREVLRRTLVGRGSIALDPISLDGSKVLAELADLIDLPEEDRSGSVKSDFVIRHGRVATDDMTLDVADVPIVLSGWTDFDGRIDYRVRSEALLSRLPKRAREFLSDLSIDVSDVSAIHLKGSLDTMKVTLDHGLIQPLVDGESSPRGVEERKLRDLGRRFRERLLR